MGRNNNLFRKYRSHRENRERAAFTCCKYSHYVEFVAEKDKNIIIIIVIIIVFQLQRELLQI